MSKCPAYCPPTCQFTINYCDYPIYCDDYDCTNPETCVVMIPSDCVVYEGTLLQQYGVQNGATATEIITQLVNLVYPGCTPTTTSTTTLCQRPTGLTNYTLNSNLVCAGVSASFINSEADACNAIFLFLNVTDCNNMTGSVVQASSLQVGEIIYLGTNTDCSNPEDGYYVELDNRQVVHIVNGIIDSITDCP